MRKPSSIDRSVLQNPPCGPVVMRQTWKDLLFAHWPVPPALVQKTLPDGLFVDTCDGQAWVGVVPFFMQNVRPVGCPCLPGVSNFLELNVRTYVHDANGVPGVWFYSLDCNQPLAVWIARSFFHLNYRHAAMHAKRDGPGISYSSRLKSAARETTFHYHPTSPPNQATPDSLEFFLVERYLLFSTDRRRRIFSGRVHHAPYEISQASARISLDTMADLTGFPSITSDPAHLCQSAGVDVNIYPLTLHQAEGRA
jgi:uncharacterized protein YqjF (DUF2071 family)